MLLNAKGEPRSGGGGGAAKPAPAKASEPKPVERPKTAATASKPAGVCLNKIMVLNRSYYVIVPCKKLVKGPLSLYLEIFL